MARSVAASTTWRNCPAETRPDGPIPARGVFEIVRICSHFTNVVSRRPLLFAVSIFTRIFWACVRGRDDHGSPAYGLPLS
jgi:hypothetical protein